MSPRTWPCSCYHALPPGEGSENLNLGGRHLSTKLSLLTLAAKTGMPRVVKALLDLGVDLMARGMEGTRQWVGQS